VKVLARNKTDRCDGILKQIKTLLRAFELRTQRSKIAGTSN